MLCRAMAWSYGLVRPLTLRLDAEVLLYFAQRYWRISRSRARDATALACCASLFVGTKRMLGRVAVS